MKITRLIPVIKCYSCGNCENDFHKSEESNSRLGFCLRFKENVSLDEKNPACWTGKENQHYKSLAIHDIKKAQSIAHKMKALAKIKGLDLTNQLLLF